MKYLIMNEMFYIFTFLALLYILYVAIYFENRRRKLTTILPITIQDTDEFKEVEMEPLLLKKDDSEWDIIDKSQ